MITFTQTPLGGDAEAGHVLRAEADIEAGHVELSATFQSVYIEGDEPGTREWVGIVCVERTVVLDGMLVPDPHDAKRLWALAVSQS